LSDRPVGRRTPHGDEGSARADDVTKDTYAEGAVNTTSDDEASDLFANKQTGQPTYGAGRTYFTCGE